MHCIMLTLPNLLTLSRIVTVPVLVALLWWPQWQVGYAIAFAVYCLMGITDYFDGYLARAQGAVSKLGIFLDPIADKIMVAAVILVLAAQGVLRGPYVGDMHVIAGLIILIREIAVSGLREFLGSYKVSMPVSRLAKWKTAFQMISLGALILGHALPNWLVNVGGYSVNLPHTVGLITLWGAAVLTVITGWDYLRVGLKHMD
jgi:cardiolipin synthase (CMP-forming)